MRLLVDQNLSFKLCRLLSDLFPGSDHVRLLGLAEADDRTVLTYAKTNGFVLVSHDSDFAELAALNGSPPKVIWLRTGNQPTGAIEAALRRHADAIAAFEQDAETACLEIY